MIKDHVLLKQASLLLETDQICQSLLDSCLIAKIVNLIPDEWLKGNYFDNPNQHRKAYITFLNKRIQNLPTSQNQLKMSENILYEYAVLRLVPRGLREKFMNIGAVLFCEKEIYIEVKFSIDEKK